MIDKVELKEGNFKVEVGLEKGLFQASTDFGGWLIGCPRCGGIMNLRNHRVTVNDKKEITVVPSIGHPANNCLLHIYVTNNKIQYLSDMPKRKL